ncbi:hypothetical protein DFH09DRAFT_934768, partial [Mycena vulgaris]
MFPGDFRGDASWVGAVNHAPWDSLPHEPKTSIHGGTFIRGNVNHIQRYGEQGEYQPYRRTQYINGCPQGLHILYRAAAGDATHDSEDRFPQPRCHPETRTKMLDVLWNWASWDDGSSSGKNSSPILWLHGPAGAGKSAVSQSLCQRLEEEGRLGASFFFKRGHPSRGHAKGLVATIAYQLALHLPDFNRHLSQSVERDPSLIDKSISIQLQRLILEPCRQITSARALVVVIDGLDECDDYNIQEEILCSIGRAINGHQLPFRFLLASRPEPHIREVFTGVLNRIHCPVNIEESFDDVRRYL